MFNPYARGFGAGNNPPPPPPHGAGRGRGRGGGPPAPQQPQMPNPMDPNGRIRNAQGVLLRARTWMVTLRNPNPPGDITSANTQRVLRNQTTLDYQVGQMEIGAAQGGLHWQGYLEFSGLVNAHDIMLYTGWIPGQVWLSPRWGTQQSAIDYVTKEDTRVEDEEPEEFGVKHRPDAAAQNHIVQQAILNGARMNNFLHDNNLFNVALRCHNGVKAMIQARDDEDTSADEERPLRVIAYYGDPRTGKTGSVRRFAKANELAVYKKPREESAHFTGYEKQEILLLDEFGQPSDRSVPPSMAQELLDKQPMILKVMYGTKKARWNYVFLCSNVPPKDWFPNAHPAVRDSIQQRIHEVWHFTKNQITLEKGPGDFAPTPDPESHPPPNIIYRPVVAPAPAAGEAPEETVQEKIQTILNKNNISLAEFERRLNAFL